MKLSSSYSIEISIYYITDNGRGGRRSRSAPTLCNSMPFGWNYPLPSFNGGAAQIGCASTVLWAVVRTGEYL
ncbi:hypothetical protein Q0590_36150 [Rhodocytophaga aerolata]|uniref:Uncharacterized protein n=1 Tax=Rhodocytophaga aerolata TaxID=455078 RepID=A0ABT8RK93_9BACT|nr:hypothetical protein [Rhodocytophaga aerolata]MDO1451763.1 hypothetical protein [Rhodocytophaga aerolata]